VAETGGGEAVAHEPHETGLGALLYALLVLFIMIQAVIALFGALLHTN